MAAALAWVHRYGMQQAVVESAESRGQTHLALVDLVCDVDGERRLLGLDGADVRADGAGAAHGREADAVGHLRVDLLRAVARVERRHERVRVHCKRRASRSKRARHSNALATHVACIDMTRD